MNASNASEFADTQRPRVDPSHDRSLPTQSRLRRYITDSPIFQSCSILNRDIFEDPNYPELIRRGTYDDRFFNAEPTEMLPLEGNGHPVRAWRKGSDVLGVSRHGLRDSSISLLILASTRT